MHRQVLANEIDEKGAAQHFVYAFIRRLVTHAEEVARMLAVERRDQLPGINIDERRHGDLLLRLANATRDERVAWWRG